MFLHLYVILFTEGGVYTPPGRHPLGRHPTPPRQTLPSRQIPSPLGSTPPPRRPLQRTVRILQECILADKVKLNTGDEFS